MQPLTPASEQDGSYPRPQLVRPGWQSLDGTWSFAFDDERCGEADRWYGVGSTAAAAFDREIAVPFPPESPASGIHETGFHPVVWYRRTVKPSDLPPANGATDRTLVHFGAVDHVARVWFDGQFVAEHVGGQTPFSVDVTDLMTPDAAEHVLVVRAEDDPTDTAMPRGKQDWQLEPHDIWYHRTTGIWQPVWAEVVPALHIVDVVWTSDVSHSSVHCDLTLSQQPPHPISVHVEVMLEGRQVTTQSSRIAGRHTHLVICVPTVAHGQERDRFLWRPERPVLLDARLELTPDTTSAAQTADPEGQSATTPAADGMDAVESYFGIRSVGVGGGSFLLNSRPYYVRSVLDQGYDPDTHLASHGPSALRERVEMIKSLGFNAVRLHQKVEDPRFLYWADRLGLLVWGETASAYQFSTTAVELLSREWADVVRRDRSHPCLVTWVPLNESWGIDDIAVDPAQRAYAVGLANLTRALDPTRPVISNDGWEHVDSDILGVHDYSSDPQEIIQRYGSDDAVRGTVRGSRAGGPAGRQVALGKPQVSRFEAGDAPLMITEFGGVKYTEESGTWGYTVVTSAEEYAEVLVGLFDALRACPQVVGYCYTQLMDTMQEANGLLTTAGKPKLPVETIKRIVLG